MILEKEEIAYTVMILREQYDVTLSLKEKMRINQIVEKLESSLQLQWTFSVDKKINIGYRKDSY